jgi:hypothetical protein
MKQVGKCKRSELLSVFSDTILMAILSKGNRSEKCLVLDMYVLSHFEPAWRQRDNCTLLDTYTAGNLRRCRTEFWLKMNGVTIGLSVWIRTDPIA